MKLFKCQHCGQLLYFENTMCERCKRTLGYLADSNALSALEPDGERWRALAVPGEQRFRFCENAGHDACNWLIPVGSPGTRCAACRHNRTIPDLSVPEKVFRWRRLEDAKHRLFYTMLRLNLPLQDRKQDPRHGLVFDFLADGPDLTGPKVMTGHDNGVITISLAEADDAERETRRAAMHEPYRTLLGHFRHEVGHHFWDLLVRDGGYLDEFRACFGDDRKDYAEALQEHYDTGVPADWQRHFISAYATTHPWEDWAETWAHYLHIVDTLEMANAFGLRVHPELARPGEFSTRLDFDPHQVGDARQLVDAWLPLSSAVNSLNRTMGHQDLYPFIVSADVVDKLGFVHRVIHQRRAVPAAAAAPMPEPAPATSIPSAAGSAPA